MLRIFQLIKTRFIPCLLLAAAYFVPLQGSMFADEWNLDVRKNDNGKIKKCVEIFKQGDVVHIFDDSGRKILRTFPHAKSGKKVEYKMTYDKQNKLSKVDCFIDGKIAFSENGNYDDKGLLRSIIRTGADKKEEFATTMIVYDDKSGCLKTYGVQTKQGIIDYFYTYTQDGKLSKVRVMINNQLASVAEYSYNAAGYVTEVRRFNEKMHVSAILRNFWKFDKHGNWIEKKSALYPNLAKRAVFAELISRKIYYNEQEK